MNVFAFSHARAKRLVDERLDGVLEQNDAGWLDEHLASCDACRAFEGGRRKLLAATRALPEVSAPDGFAARVLAAKARGTEPAPLSSPEEEARRPMARLAAGAIAAAALAAFVAIGSISNNSDAPDGLGVSGTGGLEQADLHPDFVVRAPGLGPAKARAQAVAIVESHGGRYHVDKGALHARIPRAQLVSLMRDLSKQSQYKVSLSDAGELEPSRSEVVIRFELE